MNQTTDKVMKTAAGMSETRRLLNRALFDLQTPLGRWVNMLTIVLVLIAVALSMIGTLQRIPLQWVRAISAFELIVSFLFGIEYFLRVWSAHYPLRYVFSFYGIIDLLTWLPLLLLGDVNLAIRLLRVLRLLKLIRYLHAMHLFLSSLKDSVEIMLVVATAIVMIVAIAGNVVHAIEPSTYPNAFLGSWWALVTMTTVGYGDMVPHTPAGKALAAVLMIMGITIFAMLTGTISVKIAQVLREDIPCLHCGQRMSREYGYCPACGREQPPRAPLRCQDCDSSLQPQHNFCPQCGASQRSATGIAAH